MSNSDKVTVRGTRWYANGDVYEGEWRGALRHGTGHMRFKDGRAYSGAWAGGKAVGAGRLTFPSGSEYASYEGPFDESVKCGKMDPEYGGLIPHGEGGKLTYRDGTEIR